MEKMHGLNQLFEAVVTSYSTQSTKLEEMTSKKEAYKKMVKHMRIDSDAKNRLCLKLTKLAETLCNGDPLQHQIGHQMLEMFLESVDFAEYVEKRLDAAEKAETPPENPNLLIDLRQRLASIRKSQNKRVVLDRCLENRLISVITMEPAVNTRWRWPLVDNFNFSFATSKR